MYFKDNGASWTLWNKVFKTNTLKKIAEYIPNIVLKSAEDAFILFLISIFSTKQVSIQTRSFYLYRYNVGVTSGIVTLDKLKCYTKEPFICDLIDRVLNSEKIKNIPDLVVFKDCNIWLKNKLWNTLFYRIEQIDVDLQKQAVLLILGETNLTDFLAGAERYYKGNEWKIAKTLPRERLFEKSIKFQSKIKTIGIFYRRYYSGGVERVISLLMPLFVSHGYRVILITEEIRQELEYPIPSSVTRYVVRSSYKDGRADDWDKVVREAQIDVLIHNMTSNPIVLYDCFFLQTKGVKVVLYRHETSFQDIACGLDRFLFCNQLPFLYLFANKIVLLSRMEEEYFRAFGLSAKYLPNPMDIGNVSNDYHHDEQKILWVGRLDSMQKNFLDALEIIETVVKTRPHVKCDIVGEAFSPGSDELVKKFISDHGLINNVKWHGYTLNMDSFYRHATLLLVTSAYESFPMVVVESKSYGVPLVIYELPYLELLHKKEGYISIRQGDKNAAARACIDLLDNKELAQFMSNCARRSLDEFIDQERLAKQWDEIFYEISTLNELPKLNKYLFMRSESMDQIYRRSYSVAEMKNLSDKIKVARYDKIALIVKAVCPVGSLRHSILMRTVRGLWAIINKVVTFRK